MSKYILVKDKEVLFDNRTFSSKSEADNFAKNNLNDEDYENTLVYTHKELSEELSEEMFIIIDWCYNILFKKKLFNDLDEAMNFVYEKLDEESIEDIFVIQVKDYKKQLNVA